MKLIYSAQHLKHNPPFEIYDGKFEAYSEKPERMEMALRTWQQNNLGEIRAPQHFPMSYIYEVHHRDYVDFLQRRSKLLKDKEVLYPSYYISDTYAPVTAGTFLAAKSAAEGALTGARLLLESDKSVYCLCRPPGHHASPKTMGGYCYLNNAAIGANYLSKKGKVAILDIDFHHGNGIQDIFYHRDDVFYASIHADPRVKYPYSSGYVEEKGEGRGRGYNKNYPLSLGTTNETYYSVFMEALTEISSFGPQFLVISVGFDTYEKDPIGGFKLSTAFYKKLGEGIHGLQLPTLLIQEGGYFVPDFGKNLFSFIKGFVQA